MVLPQSAVSDLLEVLRTGEAVDLIRESVRTVLQELIEAEAAEFIGATRYERSESRTNERNGSRPRMLATKAGDIDLRIPKLRKGSFFPLILEPRRRIDQALYAVVMEAYVAGVSTRSVDDLVAALGIDWGISKSEVSGICAGLDEVVTALRTRRLDHTGFPYVYLDATYLHVRNSASQVVSMAVVVATGITSDGGRAVWFPKIGSLMDNAKTEVLAFTAFPRPHWPKTWSTNPLERVDKEIKRRAGVVGIFPNEPAVIRLVGAILTDMHDERQSGERATSPRAPWPNSTRPAILTPPPRSTAARRHRRSTLKPHHSARGTANGVHQCPGRDYREGDRPKWALQCRA